jgi:hypothetical protein
LNTLHYHDIRGLLARGVFDRVFDRVEAGRRRAPAGKPPAPCIVGTGSRNTRHHTAAGRNRSILERPKPGKPGLGFQIDEKRRETFAALPLCPSAAEQPPGTPDDRSNPEISRQQ